MSTRNNDEVVDLVERLRGLGVAEFTCDGLQVRFGTAPAQPKPPATEADRKRAQQDAEDRRLVTDLMST